MRTHFLSAGVVLLTGILPSLLTKADETPVTDAPAENSVAVLCLGRLREGVVAVGGETTGTTITFQRVTWELQIPDEAGREFARRHDRELVVVNGTLRKVVGTETAVRWIVDVQKLTAHDSRERSDEGARIIIRGTLRAALSATGNIPDLSVRTNDQTWRLDFEGDRETQTAAASLIGQSVRLTGRVNPPAGDAERETAESQWKATPRVRVISVEPAPPAATDSRFFR